MTCCTNVSLPNELWLVVASYLSEQDLASCYLMNKFFLNLALDVKYKTLYLFGKGKKSTDGMVGYLEHVSQPDILRRVVTLELVSAQAHHYDMIPNTPARLVRRFTQAISLKRTTSAIPQVHSPQRIHSLIHEIILKLPNLRSLTVRETGENSALFFSVVSTIWRHVVQHPRTAPLRHLTFIGLPNDFERLFPSSHLCIPTLHRLESLSLSIHGNYRNPPTGGGFQRGEGLGALYIFLRLLATPCSPSQPVLIGQHRETRPPSLKFLSLHFDETRSQQGIFNTVFYHLSDQGEDSLPKLTRFALTTEDHVMFYFRPAIAFLELHRNNLTHLRLPTHFSIPNYHSTGITGPRCIGFAPPTMEALEHFEMRGMRVDPFQSIHNVQVYILQSTKRLTSLNLNDVYPLKMVDIEHLVRVFSSPASSSPNPFHEVTLRSMTLHLISLSPSHFNLFSKRMIGLQELRLRISTPEYPFRATDNREPILEFGSLKILDSLRSKEQIDVQEAFFDGLDRNEFLEWDLEGLSISVQGVQERILDRLEDSLRVHIPSLTWVEVGNGIDDTWEHGLGPQLQ